MVVYNYSGKEINAKIVYYGPALSGKTTNLEWIYSKIPVEYSGKMVSLRTQADRTIFFDFLPLDLGMIDGFRTRFMLYTVPGQVHYNATRKMVLKGVDGLVFVADSEPGRMQENLESLQNLRDNLQELGMNPDALPLVMQWNKRDLPNCMSVTELETRLNPRGLPSFEACALTGEGVYETLHKASRLIYTKLTGQQASSDEDVSLFGESIAQCLQDIDVPQPIPEAVAVGPQSAPVHRASSADPLGAILGRDPRPAASAPVPPRSEQLTQPVAPVRSTPETEESPMPETHAAPPSGPPSISTGPDRAPHGFDHDAEPVFARAPQQESTADANGSLSRPVPSLSRPIEPVDDMSDRLGGLVDEVLSSLDERDDLATIDRASSRSVAPSDGDASASFDVGPLAERLDRFFEGIEPSGPVRIVDADPSGPVTPPPPASDASPENEGVFSIEHDKDVFDELQTMQSGPRSVEVGGAGAPAEADTSQESAGQDLELITDPRKLPTAGSGPVQAVSPTTGPKAGVLEIPVTIDASVLEDDVPLRIVLNLKIER